MFDTLQLALNLISMAFGFANGALCFHKFAHRGLQLHLRDVGMGMNVTRVFTPLDRRLKLVARLVAALFRVGQCFLRLFEIEFINYWGRSRRSGSDDLG